MTNHPNRNWRRVAFEAALRRSTRWRFTLPDDSPIRPISADGLDRIEDEIQAAYTAGFEAGRDSTRKPQP